MHGRVHAADAAEEEGDARDVDGLNMTRLERAISLTSEDIEEIVDEDLDRSDGRRPSASDVAFMMQQYSRRCEEIRSMASAWMISSGAHQDVEAKTISECENVALMATMTLSGLDDGQPLRCTDFMNTYKRWSNDSHIWRDWHKVWTWKGPRLPMPLHILPTTTITIPLPTLRSSTRISQGNRSA